MNFFPSVSESDTILLPLLFLKLNTLETISNQKEEVFITFKLEKETYKSKSFKLAPKINLNQEIVIPISKQILKKSIHLQIEICLSQFLKKTQILCHQFIEIVHVENNEIVSFFQNIGENFLLHFEIVANNFPRNWSKKSKLKKEKIELLEKLSSDGLLLRELSDEQKRDHEIVLTAIKNNPKAMEFASLEILDDKEFILEAIKHGFSFEFVSKDLRNDKEFVLDAIKKGNSLRLIPEDDQKFPLESMKNGNILKYLSEELRNDKDIVLAAVRKNGFSLEFASEELKNSEEIVNESVNENPNSLIFASIYMKENKQIIKNALKNSGYFDIVPEKFQSDPDIILTSMTASLELTIELLKKRNLEYVFGEHISLYLFVKYETTKYEIPEIYLHKIAMKMSRIEIYQREAMKIFEREILNQNEYQNEAYFELGVLYFNGVEKNFEKSRNYFEHCCEVEFKANESTKYLKNIARYTNNLDTSDISQLEQCSSNSDRYIIKKMIFKSTDAFIFLVENKSNLQTYVMKRFSIDNFNFNAALKEVILLMKLKSEYVCEIIDFFINEEEDVEDKDIMKYFFNIIMPLYDCDLFDFIKKKPLTEIVFNFILNSSEND
jgi:hypothetical protein